MEGEVKPGVQLVPQRFGPLCDFSSRDQVRDREGQFEQTTWNSQISFLICFSYVRPGDQEYVHKFFSRSAPSKRTADRPAVPHAGSSLVREADLSLFSRKTVHYTWREGGRITWLCSAEGFQMISLQGRVVYDPELYIIPKH